MTLLLIVTETSVRAISLPTLQACIDLGTVFVGAARVFCVIPGGSV